MLQPVKSNSPVYPAIGRDIENSLLVHLMIYPGLLQALSLEYDEGRKGVAICTNTLNNRDPFPITGLYRENLLFFNRYKYFDIISDTSYKVFLVHIILVLVWDTKGCIGLVV